MTPALSDYLEGVMRVPLRLLTSDGFFECPTSFSDSASVSDFKRFLNDGNQPITGIVSPQKLTEILQSLAVTQQEFRRSIDGKELLSNPKFQIDCLVGQHCLDKARQRLGQNHGCIVRIYSIPPELPGRYSDGEICRQILLLYQKQPAKAQKWLERLSPGKRKHVTMVCHRKGIWSAMENAAVFPGLWEDIKLGNWAKHLAAHVDEQIQVYWKHIFRVWNTHIFAGVDPNLRQYLDVSSARFLQFTTPAWSGRDQKAIRKRMNNGSLFCNISNEETRHKLLRNILDFKGVIPSVLTFHENMRYLTVGAKILEKHVEVKRATKKAGPDLAPAKNPESLLDNLTQDWGKEGGVRDHVECHEGKFQPTCSPLDAQIAFVQLMLAAIRWFPFLSSEAPLQDVKGLGMPAYTDDYHRRRLCSTARSLGFWNKRIEDGLALPDLATTREMPETLPMATESVWRGGLPTISVFVELTTTAFLPTLNSAARENEETEPSSTLIQSDFVSAFFGPCRVALAGPIFETTTVATPDAPGLDTDIDMGWAPADVEFVSEQPPAERQVPSAHVTEVRAQIRDKRKGIVLSNKKKVLKPKGKQKKTVLRVNNKTTMQLDALPEFDVPEPQHRISVPQVDGFEEPSQIETGRMAQQESQQQIQEVSQGELGSEHGRSQELQVHDTTPAIPSIERRISAPVVEEHVHLQDQALSKNTPETTVVRSHRNYIPIYPERVETDRVEINEKKKQQRLDSLELELREIKRSRMPDDSDPVVPDRVEAPLYTWELEEEEEEEVEL